MGERVLVAGGVWPRQSGFVVGLAWIGGKLVSARTVEHSAQARHGEKMAWGKNGPMTINGGPPGGRPPRDPGIRENDSLT